MLMFCSPWGTKSQEEVSTAQATDNHQCSISLRLLKHPSLSVEEAPTPKTLLALYYAIWNVTLFGGVTGGRPPVEGVVEA